MMYFFIKMQVSSAELKIELLPRVVRLSVADHDHDLGFGICFQLPVALSLLARAGFLDGNQLRTFRRYAIVGIALVAAVLAPRSLDACHDGADAGALRGVDPGRRPHVRAREAKLSAAG